MNGSWYYYIYNAHGDVVGLVDDSGNIKNIYTYDPWGNILSETETVDNPIKYAGEYYDNELDMIYLRARYYNPNIGRFTSLDIEEGEISNSLDMNRYVYCRNNPIKYVDSRGTNPIAMASSLFNSPLMQQASGYLSQLGASAYNYGVQLVDKAQQAVVTVGQYGAVVWDWTTNTAAPWLAEKAQQTGQAISDAAEKAGNWIKEKWSNTNNGDPNKKPSLKNVNNKTANDIAKKNGFKDAHDFKESIVGKSNISKFNIKVDKNTGEIFLESVKKGGNKIATGYYK